MPAFFGGTRALRQRLPHPPAAASRPQAVHRGQLPGRHRQQRRHIPCQGRCDPQRGHDHSQHGEWPPLVGVRRLPACTGEGSKVPQGPHPCSTSSAPALSTPPPAAGSSGLHSPADPGAAGHAGAGGCHGPAGVHAAGGPSPCVLRRAMHTDGDGWSWVVVRCRQPCLERGAQVAPVQQAKPAPCSGPAPSWHVRWAITPKRHLPSSTGGAAADGYGGSNQQRVPTAGKCQLAQAGPHATRNMPGQAAFRTQHLLLPLCAHCSPHVPPQVAALAPLSALSAVVLIALICGRVVAENAAAVVQAGPQLLASVFALHACEEGLCARSMRWACLCLSQSARACSCCPRCRSGCYICDVPGTALLF